MSPLKVLQALPRFRLMNLETSHLTVIDFENVLVLIADLYQIFHVID